MKVCISTESTADLSPELLKEYDISVIPFRILLGEDIMADGEINALDIFNFVEEKKILPRTSAINFDEYTEYFNELLKKYDVIVHIAFGTKMSSSCTNAVRAASKLENIYIVDSASLSTGVGLQCIYARELANAGVAPEEIVKKLEKRRDKVQASFVVNTLEYLYKGGRCSGLSRVIGAVLRIKPQIVLRDGMMVPGKKYMGRQSSCVRKYCEDILEEFPKIDKRHVFITHSHASPEMIEEARNALKAHGVENIHETIAGCTISSHCGPKCLGILYYADGGEDY
ncbi:MAG: DegV family protein [Bacilli bacterium]|nr:DegV family protein [Bacilli bacterium]